MTEPGRKPVRVHVRVKGTVQGVGFRPFVFRLAQRYGLSGGVRNDSRGVEIEAEGAADALRAFVGAIEAECPPVARIQSVYVQEIEPCYDRGFTIWPSEARAGERTLAPPDMAVCHDCRRELFDPSDRRFRYQFINCTNCGPRYTIVLDAPYDRPLTTMRAFAMCAACEREYHDPGDRRFHAQPNACAQCGPRVWLDEGHGEIADGDDAIRTAQEHLRAGRIVAVKGLGGFHLAVDARNETAVAALRERKRREQKPFAVMCASLDIARRLCRVSAADAELLASPAAPIVLMPRRCDAGLAPSVAPASHYFGLMLPSTPLHWLLFGAGLDALVMTSGNLTDEPIAIDNREAMERLAGIADAFLLHDRGIHLRADDSVCRVDARAPAVVRRSRGYAPEPVAVGPGPAVLAVGAELKNTVCLTRGEDAILSQHVGDLKNMETLLFFRKTVQHLERLLDVEPAVIAHDLHPDYLSTRYAVECVRREDRVRLAPVQHHFAHVASCMAEHGLHERVIGIAFDGAGYGTDAAVWGGEFLLANRRGFARVGHLRYTPLPGGDAAAKQPWRMAIAHLREAFGASWRTAAPRFAERLDEEDARVVEQMLGRRVNSPPTSSMGRLFDAVSALCGVAMQNTYEGQAAMELEARVDDDETGSYDVDIEREAGAWLVDTRPLIRGVAQDLHDGAAVGCVAARFHRAVVRLMVDMCCCIRDEYSIDAVCLSGGVFQNQHLIEWGEPALERDGFRVYRHARVPANDGGIALGQAAVAMSLAEDSTTCA